MAKSFIWIEETRKDINEFSIGYMINPKLNINKAFIEQGHKFLNNTFVPSTKPFIRATLAKNNTTVLA